MRACLAVAVLVCGLLGLAGCGAGSGGGSNAAPALKPPVANAGGPYTGTVGTAVSFSGAASSDPQGEALTEAWNFGDNATGTGVSPGHAYATTGTYTVSLTVTDTSNLTNSATSKVTISIDPLSDVGLTGLIYGGQTPIVGAHVYLFAANSTGYGGNGIAASNSNTSVSLLSAAETGTTDAVGAYVLTGSNGGFSLTGDYTCSSGQQLYLYALGGTNSAAGLMAAIGSCPGSGGPAIFATVNEVTTIAAAYAFAGFATDATHVSSSGTALAQVGIANAFANAANLGTLGTGVALATTPAGNGTVPQAEINTLANILAACVNSNGTGSACTTLFSDALSGGTSGTQPTDTATAAINLAHNPGTNVAALYGLSTSNPPFAPVLGALPNDFTISLIFTGGALNDPTAIAVDATGNAWVTNYYGNSITKVSATGAVLSGTTGFTGGLLFGPNGVAIDDSGNAWISGYGGQYKFSKTGSFVGYPQGYTSGFGSQSSVAVDGSGDAWFAAANLLSEYSNSGNAVSGPNPYFNHGLQAQVGQSIAIDGAGSAWVANSPGTVTVVSSSGSYVSGANGYTVAACCLSYEAIALDGAGNAWIADERSSEVIEVSNSGALLSGSSGYTGGGVQTPDGVGIDGAGRVWVVGASVAELSSTGAILSGSTGYKNSYFYLPYSMALDGSGDLWVGNSGYMYQPDSIVEFIGVATPVITPIAAGLPATPTADGSSKLGTRP